MSARERAGEHAGRGGPEARRAGSGRPAAPGRGAQALGDVLGQFFGAHKLGRAITREALDAGLRGAVRAAAGEGQAGQVRATGLRERVLAAEVASSALLQELATFHKPALLAALRKGGSPFADLKDITFKLGAFDRP